MDTVSEHVLEQVCIAAPKSLPSALFDVSSFKRHVSKSCFMALKPEIRVYGKHST